MTLAEIATTGSQLFFKRPKHGNSYCFWQGEMREWGSASNMVFHPRLTIEDLIADDWGFVA